MAGAGRNTFGCIIGFLVGIVQTIPVDKNDSTAKKVIIKVVKFIMACYVEFFSWDSNDGPGNVYLFWKCLSI